VEAAHECGSLTLIFASYLHEQSASMYGHTFSEVERVGSFFGKSLCSIYAVNFGADVPRQSGFLFAVYGLSGVYRGRFSTLPYYMKVQEYSHLESRDLWEYRLALDPGSMDRFIRHLWEMGSASMSYFFLNKNCSYQLLPLLEVARPSMRLAAPFWLKTTPAIHCVA